MKLLKIESTGTRMAHSMCGDVAFLPVYPPSPEGRRARSARVAAEVTLRELARRLGISAVELSDIERGAAVPEDWSEFWRASELPGDAKEGA